LKYPLKGQQETEFEPFHSHHKTKAIISLCGVKSLALLHSVTASM